MSKLERFWRWLAWLLPRDLVMWCGLRMMTHATQGPWGNEHPGTISMMDMLGRWQGQTSVGCGLTPLPEPDDGRPV
ncbi:MAG TPA: hypothetical protein PLC98_24560 [Anaerolineales bacterium]|nr:hypothetical protein [Anaerolineales bacterium]